MDNEKITKIKIVGNYYIQLFQLCLYVKRACGFTVNCWKQLKKQLLLFGGFGFVCTQKI
jgi:hypothetical protein